MPELSEQIRQLIDRSAPPVTIDEVDDRRAEIRRDLLGEVDYRSARQRERTLVRPFAVAAVIVALVALGTFVAVANVGGGHRPISAKTHNPKVAKWQLAADLSSSSYELATGNPGGGVSEVECGGTTCFLSTYYGVGGNTSLTGATYVSHDAGHTWEPSILPLGVATATSVSCVSSSWCAAGGGLLDPSTGDPAAKKEMRDPELLTTADAGATWTMHAVPIPPDVQQLPAYGSLPAETTYWPGIVDAVDCTAPGVCNVMAHVLNNNNQTAGLIPDTVMFLRTTDGGVTWSSSILPETAAESGFEEQVPNGNEAAIACPTNSECVAVTALSGFNPSQGFVDVWRTTDAGRTWQETQIPGLHQVFPGISCPDANECWVPTGSGALRSVDGGSTWTSVTTPTVPTREGILSNGWQSISCSSATDCVLAGPGMVATVDGGTTWAPVTLPSQVGNVPSVSCEPQGSCIAFAQPVPSPGQAFVPNGGSMILTNGPSVSVGTKAPPTSPS
jgi:hypothetical protein